MATKADVADMERRALKNEVDAGFRTQMSDLHALLRTKADDAEFKVRHAGGSTGARALQRWADWCRRRRRRIGRAVHCRHWGPGMP